MWWRVFACAAGLCAALVQAAAAADDAAEGVCATGEGTCGPAATCAAGVFLALVGQPDLALRHIEVGEEALTFARRTRGACVLDYSVACGAGGAPEVRESPLASCGADSAKTHLLGTTSARQDWEVCAESTAELQALHPMIDLTFDYLTPTPVSIHGCVRLSVAGTAPELAQVRGTVETQRAALIARKEEVGGCPTWRTPDDFVARGYDFAAGGHRAFGLAVRLYQSFLVQQAEELKRNGPPAEESIKGFALIGGMIALNDFKNTEAYLAFTKANCGVAIPMGIGVMAKAKFSVVAGRAGDLHQERRYVCPWASGCSDVCFHPTLPLFLSSGSAEHTQTRRLWDATGMTSMHAADFADLSSSAGAASMLRRLKDAVGFTEPSEEEVAALIAPLLIERIFRKRPTEAESALFTQYATYGKLCIKGAIIAKGPWLPGKIREIRTALAKFALDSPRAKEMEELLKKPDYAELRRLYESTGEGVLWMAVQNLADATLFAGLVGTTDMTFKCVKYQFRNPSHLRMFRHNPTDYLWEMMRVQPAVQGFTSLVGQPQTFKMYGMDVELPAGTPYKFSNSMANRDPEAFTAPAEFNPQRPWAEMGEMLSWNGKLKHVVARNYTGAPRHCPGHDLSIKIGTHVCQYLTRSLAA